MFVYVGRVPGKIDYLVRVHELAQEAAASRARVVEAMALARAAGANELEIAEASGLSIRAVVSLLARYDQEAVDVPAGPFRRVGRPPDPRRLPRT
jgi:hypothetical protein